MNKVNVYAASCPNCGANVSVGEDAKAVVCQYCSSILAASVNTTSHHQHANYESNNDTNNDTGYGVRLLLRKVEPEVKFTANFYESSGNSQGGHLWITKDEVVFKPHSFNFGNLAKKYIRIEDVAGYSKGFLFNFSIWTKNKEEMPLAVYKKGSIIEEIEERRIRYYQERGLPVPQLVYGNI